MGGGGGGGGGSSVEATLRRNVSNPTHSLKLNGSNAANAASLLLENQRKKQSWDGANGRSLENIDRPWPASQEEVSSASPKWSPMHSKTISECSTPVNGQSLSVDLSPVEERGGGGGGPPPLSSNTQTYREYKEALKQQRNQDTTAVYRSKDNTSSSSSSGGSNQASPMSPVNGVNKSLAADVITIKPKLIMATGTAATTGRQSSQEGDDQGEEKSNGLEEENSRNNNIDNTNNGGYVKPASPAMGGVEARNGTRSGDSTDSLVIKSIMNGNLRTATNNNSNGTGSGRLGDNNGKTGAAAAAATAAKNPKRTVSWNRDIVTPEKQTISFTMRREFDRHKEEAELIGKLRNVSGRGKEEEEAEDEIGISFINPNDSSLPDSGKSPQDDPAPGHGSCFSRRRRPVPFGKQCATPFCRQHSRSISGRGEFC